jgi:hypothetical protein
MRISEDYVLTDLRGIGQLGGFLERCRLAKSRGERWLRLHIDAREGSIEVAKAWHAVLMADPGVAVVAKLYGHSFLPAYIVWLGAVGLETAHDATLWFGNDIIPYSDAFRAVQNIMMSRMVFTMYQENRGYRMRRSLDLLLSTTIVGPRELHELHYCTVLPP